MRVGVRVGGSLCPCLVVWSPTPPQHIACLGHSLLDACLPFVWLYLASDVYLMVFRSASTSTSRLAEKPGQDTQLITVDEKLVRIPPGAT